ncbi:hypothetical protein [Paraferrimonas sp. SM1919]|uniref:hypothetical protein n=1 Tax=Paraferrimonas sp. SM1919 TaxID=2662263 RepID=UPI0013D0967A|nr:hypothetical protein [Paraferrimonas sp. SM1919]
MKQIVALTFLLFSSFSFANESTENVVLEGIVSLDIPQGFSRMSDELARRKYPMEQRAKSIFTNSQGNVDILVNYTQNKVPDNQEDLLRQALSNNMKRMHPTAQWHSNEVVEINGHKYAFLELTTPALDTDIHNVMLATTVNGRVLIISFNMTVELEEKWLDKALKTVRTAKIISS